MCFFGIPIYLNVVKLHNIDIKVKNIVQSTIVKFLFKIVLNSYSRGADSMKPTILTKTDDSANIQENKHNAACLQHKIAESMFNYIIRVITVIKHKLSRYSDGSQMQHVCFCKITRLCGRV